MLLQACLWKREKSGVCMRHVVVAVGGRQQEATPHSDVFVNLRLLELSDN